jgi:uncharacterized cofD-like protein
MNSFVKNWWKWLRYEPNDPLFKSGRIIRIAVIGGGTGLANLLRGLKQYSTHISAVVTVADEGGSTGQLREDFDMLAPGDIRKCIGALASDESLLSNLLEHRFSKEKKLFGGHTLGNIWITALTDYFGSFEKAVEATSEIFQTAGRVLPATLSNIDLVIKYDDGSILKGEHYLDEVLKKVAKVTLTKPKVAAYGKAVAAISSADLIIVGPGSLYGSIVPNLLIKGIRDAVSQNKNAVKVYVANCSTERTQTRNFTIEDHIKEIKKYGGKKIVEYCLVNDKILRSAEDETVLGEIHNITTKKKESEGVKIVLADVINDENPLFHDSDKLAKSLIELYNKIRQK